MIELSWVRSRPRSRTRSVFSSRCSARLASGERLGQVAGLGADDAGVPVRRGAGHGGAEPLGLGDGAVAQLGRLDGRGRP